MPLLEIAIPNYNRLETLRQTIESVFDSVCLLDLAERRKTAISIHNNSTSNFDEFKSLTRFFSKRFASVGLQNFRSCISGVDIGVEQNILGLILSSSAKYIWILPDDDIAAIDSIPLILKLVSRGEYAFLLGSMGSPQHSIEYQYVYCLESGEGKPEGNSLHCINSYPESIKSFFLSNHLVAIQEMIFNLDALRPYVYSSLYRNLIDPFLPFTLAIFCLNSKLPCAYLSNSIGYYRKDDPSSAWRHLWFKLLLHDWPVLIRSLYHLKLIPSELFKSIYFQILTDANIFSVMSSRLDILFGLNSRYRVNLFVSLCNYPFFVLTAILASPFHFCNLLMRKVRFYRISR